MDKRPDPDSLLAAINSERKRFKEGKLRIFFGMSAGVGKTYAMLNMARQKIQEGMDVVIGTVDTHGRKETEKLVEGVPIIPKKKIEHRDVVLEEMDLDAILERHPQIVLVDELAHTNIPGSRHPKRWQDVFEILENGIDVYSTINIQHIESRKDDVESITNIKIYETVPDSVLERANHIEVIDIPPEDLLIRLKDGKVYLKDKAAQAVDNFFKADKLTALREILLRISADKVDKDLEILINQANKEHVWKTQEKILVAIGYGPLSEKLVRTTKQFATKLKSPWIALYVETGQEISEEDQKIVTLNLDLARELGAKVITTAETDLVKGIDRICRQFQVTQVVIGKPSLNILRNILRGGNIIERLNRIDNNISLHIVRQKSDKPEKSFQLKNLFPSQKFVPKLLGVTLWVILLNLFVGYLHHSLGFLSYRTTGLIFLLGVCLTALFLSFRATVWASVLSVFFWNFFFIPPLYSLKLGGAEDTSLVLSFFFVTLIVGSMTSIIKRGQNLLRRQEGRTNALYQITLNIVEAETKDECLDKVCASLAQFFKGYFSVTLRDPKGALEYFKKGQDWVFNQPKEWAVALWAFENAKPAGMGTDTITRARCMYVPIVAKEEVIGVMGFRPTEEEVSFSVNDREVLFAICSQLGLYFKRGL